MAKNLQKKRELLVQLPWRVTDRKVCGSRETSVGGELCFFG